MIEYCPVEFGDHQPQKFQNFLPTQGGFYLLTHPDVKYTFDEQKGWMDQDGCYYNAEGKPSGWIQLSKCGRQYQQYDMDLKIVKQAKNIHFIFDLQEQKFEKKVRPEEPRVQEVVQNQQQAPQHKTKNIAAVTIETKEQLDAFISQINQDFEHQQQSSKYIIILNNQKLKINVQQQALEDKKQEVQKPENNLKHQVEDKNPRVEVKPKDQMTDQQLQLTQAPKKVLKRPQK